MQTYNLNPMRAAASESPSSPSRLVRPDRDLLTASLLLFLARGSGYGYGLSEQLLEQGLDVEMTVAYRVLRGLERDGQLSSRWIESVDGPRRRMYSMTGAGRRTLDALVPRVMLNRDRYAQFVRAYDEARRRRGDADVTRPPGDPGDGDAVLHPERDLLPGWLLLLLDGDASYGYDLRKHLAAHEVAADPAKLYRLLRSFDAEGWLTSHWSDPVLGPQRRLYRVTPKGRRRLDEIAAAIEHARGVHDAFIDAYEHVNDDHRGPAPPSA
jgi:DNA-binding PadR family transcriptional regulator